MFLIYRLPLVACRRVSIQLENAKYTFDTSDPSNAGHPLKFSETQDGTHNGGEISFIHTNYIGEAGTEDSRIEVYTYDDDFPETLYYFCEIHPGMANDSVMSWQEEGDATFTQLYQKYLPFYQKLFRISFRKGECNI